MDRHACCEWDSIADDGLCHRTQNPNCRKIQRFSPLARPCSVGRRFIPSAFPAAPPFNLRDRLTMKCAAWLSIPFALILCLMARADIILTHNVTYTQNFDTLASSPDGGTSTTLPGSPNGWAFDELNSNADTSYSIGNGSSTVGDTYSFGATGSTERAFGSMGQNSPTRNQNLGVRFRSNGSNTQAFTKLIITFTGEQWRLGSTGRVDRLDFQVSTDATALNNGTWVDFNALDFVAPVTTGTVGALDGNLAANQVTLSAKITLATPVSPGSAFWLRWRGLDATGAEDGLGIDNFSIRAIPEPMSFPFFGGALFGMLVFGLIVSSWRRKQTQLAPVPIRNSPTDGR